MQAWLDSVVPGYGLALTWTLAALIGLLILLIAIRIFRGLTFGTFVAGGRNRKTRLAVMDATAVDSHRRLVLVRRDDVEHLILIGGQTDVVVEQNIRLLPASRRPAGAEASQAQVHPAPKAPEPLPASPVPAPRPQPNAVRPAPAAPAAPTQQPARPAAATPHPATPVPAPTPPQAAPAPVQAPVAVEPRFTSIAASEPVRPPTPAAPRPVTVAPVEPPAKPDLDKALLEELEVSLDREHKMAASPKPEASDIDRSLDEEMNRLLSDLSGPRR